MTSLTTMTATSALSFADRRRHRQRATDHRPPAGAPLAVRLASLLASAVVSVVLLGSVAVGMTANASNTPAQWVRNAPAPRG